MVETAHIKFQFSNSKRCFDGGPAKQMKIKLFEKYKEFCYNNWFAS